MLFGWKAAESLKTTNLSYMPTTAAWKRYFDPINRNSLYAAYVGSEEGEQGAGDGLAAALATGVMLAPMAFLAYQELLR